MAVCWKELSPCAVFILLRLNCRCPYPVSCLRQDVEFDCIGSRPLPFYLLYKLFDRCNFQRCPGALDVLFFVDVFLETP